MVYPLWVLILVIRPPKFDKWIRLKKKMRERTSAGTQGVVCCKKPAILLLTSSFVVASATVQYVMKNPLAEVKILITGG
jgi:hypothetical protein